jgi:hypothetical protein
MENKLKYLLLGFLVILGVSGYVFGSSNVFYYFIIPLLGLLVSYWITEAKNKGKMDVFNIITWIGSGALILSGVMLIITKTTSYVLGIIISLGILAFMIGFYEYIGMEEPKDERLKKIGTTAATYSWHITLLLIGSFIVSSIWSGDKNISIASLGLILFVMVATMLGANVYLNRKGDVN